MHAFPGEGSDHRGGIRRWRVYTQIVGKSFAWELDGLEGYGIAEPFGLKPMAFHNPLKKIVKTIDTKALIVY
jgi:hypothetical protein